MSESIRAVGLMLSDRQAGGGNQVARDRFQTSFESDSGINARAIWEGNGTTILSPTSCTESFAVCSSAGGPVGGWFGWQGPHA